MANAETGTVEYDNLLLGDVQALSDTRTLESGSVTRGQILKLGTGAKVVAFDEYDAATDAHAICAVDADATGGEVPVRIYTFGQFSADVVAEETGVEIDDALKNALWARGLHVRETTVLE